MKPIKISLRLWITLGSVVSFLGGWALFSHAGKPVPLIQTQSIDPAATTSQTANTTLDPIPSVQDLLNTNLQPLPSLPSLSNNNTGSSQSFFPRLRTRGS